jgi:predicted O-methyltransferase YrrM
MQILSALNQQRFQNNTAGYASGDKQNSSVPLVEFLRNIAHLLEKEKLADAAEYYRANRNTFGNDERLVEIDSLFNSLHSTLVSGSLSDAQHGERFCTANVFDIESTWYTPALSGAQTLSEYLYHKQVYLSVIQILKTLDSDEYVDFVTGFMKKGIQNFGANWKYADICTVLFSLSSVLEIEEYLEIGVRRGRSMAMVCSARPRVNIVGFDIWKKNYAGMDNPGPEFVISQMKQFGHTGKLDLISGNSHLTLKEYFSKNTSSYFDIITVDGDHSENGAIEDIEDVISRVRVGGAIVFDDIAHPQHPYLRRVWEKHVKTRPEFTTHEYDELGYGVAFGIRMK